MTSRRRGDVKVSGNDFRKAAPAQRGELKHVTGRRTKVKVSELMSPEGQLAIMMVQEETVQERQQLRGEATTQKTDKPTTVIHVLPPHPPKPPDSTGDDGRSSTITTTATSATTATTDSPPGFAEALERVCTLRLPGDITDKNYTPRKTRKRALRFGDRLHNAMEVVEIVRHADCDDEDHSESESDEEEALQRAATISSVERCMAWVELHFDNDDTSSQCSADR
ncbi:hypothetical protein BaRGS_00004837 [Batillaria attramentaria]|uniref:Uncharacterized protein n=1 Tax=Batillaria attramentaria TaxID=370345 RepID=A0ABD0LVW4_9CAEN